ncbi:MAG: ROK family protein, partial [Nitrospinota bacterium]
MGDLLVKYFIGLDVGGTNIRGGAVSAEGKILYKSKMATNVSRGRQEVADNILALTHSIVSYIKTPPSAIGIGVAGLIRGEEGIIAESPNFPDWIEYDLKTPLEKALKLKVVVENDANAAAIGEGWLGAGAGEKNFCLLTLGTGIGGGVFLGGKIWRGVDGMAGELGHINIHPEGRRCGCGNRGCLEQYASAQGIIKSYQERRPVKGEFSAKGIFDLAAKGNGEAIDILRGVGSSLGIAITDLVNILNVRLFIIGGGVAGAWDYFIEPLKGEIAERA